MTAADVVPSATWERGGEPEIAALVATFGRPAFLAELFAALEAQALDPSRYEVVVVDNGSADDTWATLTGLVRASPCRALAVRVAENRGPGRGRNIGARHVRAPLIAITDDDCLPTPHWLPEVLAAFTEPGVDVVQGRVEADPRHRDSSGPWDHTIWVSQPTPFFETCNVSYRRGAFERAGGFDEHDPLLHPRSGRAFGEDACLAWEVQRAGGRAAFAPAALVVHRVVPSTLRRVLRDQRDLRGFPGLARRSPLVARWFWHGVFLDRASAEFDLAVVSALAALLTRRRGLLVGTLPWLRARWGLARHKVHGPRRPAVPVLAGLIASDAVGLASKLEGSVRHRRLLL